MPYSDREDFTTADYLDTTTGDDGPSYTDAGYHDSDTGFGFKSIRRAARGAVKTATRAATRGVPAVAKLMQAPDLLQKTTSAAGATALRALRKADPAAYLAQVRAGARTLASRPEFNTAISAARLIPGIGQAVSPGLAAAAALGRGESIEDAALTAAREGFENPAAAFAFDTAVGLAKGGELPDAAIEAARDQVPGGPAGKAAFDAGLALARRSAVSPDMVTAVRDGLDGETGAFDNAIRRAARAVRVDNLPEFGQLNMSGQQAARAFMRLPRLRRMRLRDAAEEIGVPVRTAQEAVAACCNHMGDTGAIEWSDVGDLDTAEETARRVRVVRPGQSWDSAANKKIRPINVKGARRVPRIAVSRQWAQRLGKVGGPAVMAALVRHGVLARIAADTGELTGPTQWTIRTGDFPSGVAAKLTGSGGRWKELLAVNPGMQTYTDAKGQTQIKPWNVGDRINVPTSWVGGSTAPTPATPTPTAPAPSMPAPVATSSSSGGPPFPPPSQYPQGYPGSTYTVVAGDYGTKIAEKITGNGARWRELLVLQPQKADPKNGIAVYAGDVLKLPQSWQAMAAPTKQPAPSTPAIPVPATPPPGFPAGLPGIPTPAQPTPAQAVIATAQQVALVQAMLVTFHGKHPEAGFLAPYGAARYGGQGDDLSGTWSQRSQAALASFERWWNTKAKQPPVPEDGYPDERAVAALQRQTSDDLALPVPAMPAAIPGAPTGTVPGAPTQTTATSSPSSSSSSSSGGGAAALAALAAAAAFLM